MLVVLKKSVTESEIDHIRERVEALGFRAHLSRGEVRTVIGLVGDHRGLAKEALLSLQGVEEVHAVTKPYKQVSREWREADTIVEISGGIRFGGPEVPIIAGPCAVESDEQIFGIADQLRAMGASLLRGGAFKPRTSPYSWQGLGEEGLKMLARAREATGLAIVTEALDPDGVDLVAEYADVLQIGARNMQNYPLLRRAGKCGKPVLLKRGMSATINELLLAAEYLLAEGNDDVILCERGVRSFDNHTRNLLDLTAVPVVKALSHLPIIADPSHGTGVRDKVIPMARASVAAGADGLMVEVHPDPPSALSDGAQSLYPEQFSDLMEQIRVIATAIGRSVKGPA
jgi:3-deoxy-7-phosphoheptulonate synthase